MTGSSLFYLYSLAKNDPMPIGTLLPKYIGLQGSKTDMRFIVRFSTSKCTRRERVISGLIKSEC